MKKMNSYLVCKVVLILFLFALLFNSCGQANRYTKTERQNEQQMPKKQSIAEDSKPVDNVVFDIVEAEEEVVEIPAPSLAQEKERVAPPSPKNKPAPKNTSAYKPTAPAAPTQAYNQKLSQYKKQLDSKARLSAVPEPTAGVKRESKALKIDKSGYFADQDRRDEDFNTEDYEAITENDFKNVTDEPLSTFSIDVDAASYSNTRRFIRQNQLPPRNAVRIEEFINYFNYDYPQPKGEHPFSITTELASAPWNEDNRLLHIGLQGEKVDMSEAPASNLVFLLDVSGSMNSPNKLPLLKKSFRLLVDQMRPRDRIAIAVYAGAAGLVLPSTSCDNKLAILEAIDKLSAGGSTAGGAGIQLAYKVAQENFVANGNNRIILATDGDFNVGLSSDAVLVDMIEEKRKSGIFLTVLGFGGGNYKDNKMEKLADKGNGNYAYIDNIREAKKVLVNEVGGTLFAIAKDVKIQIEFNPTHVKAYRLIGYENRMLAARDFNDDTKDAGELGAGHTVTALYELIPADSDAKVGKVDPLKYQTSKTTAAAKQSGELLTVKFRYKPPKESKSQLITQTVTLDEEGTISDNFTFSAAVAGFGMLLRKSKYKGHWTYPMVLEMAKQGKGKDEEGYRAEFINLVEMVMLLEK